MGVASRLVTAEEFEQMPDEPGVRMELVRGRVVRVSPPGFRHGVIGGRLFLLLAAHVEHLDLGHVVLPVGFRIAWNPDSVREPDIAFISKERLGRAGAGDGFFQGPPDLAVEVVSPTERRGNLNAKIAQYLETGVRMVWLVDPKRGAVTVYEPGSDPVTLREDAILEGGDVLPGFACDLRRIFPQR